ncbi:MAG TPA: hypothetical protein VM536_07175 [Chloroflexia bacterium]|nr:hypothetical protein [Chloroflexia bacterium]
MTTITVEPQNSAPARTAPSPVGPGPRPTWRETALLLLLAVVSEVVYFLGFVVPYPLAGNATEPFLDLNRLSGHTPESANYFAVTWAVTFAAMFIAYRRCPPHPTRAYFAVLGGAALLFSATLMLMYPTGAADLFDQLFQARELAVYGKNPLLYPPGHPFFADDPFLQYIGPSWKNAASPYGPVWQLLSAAAAWLAGTDLWRLLIALKGLVVLAYGGTALLIYATLRRVRPEWAARGALFFAWNPLVIWETAGNGHNDIVMALFTVLCCYLLARGGRWMLLAPAALALGALTKYICILLLPIVLVAIWQMRRPPAGTPIASRDRWYTAATGVLLSMAGFLAVAVALYVPFWFGPDTIGVLLRRDLFTASLPNSLKDLLVAQLHMGEAAARAFVHNLANWIVIFWVIFSTAWLLFTTRPRDREGVLAATYRSGYGIFFIYLVFGTLWFQPWYQVWFIALAPLTMSLRDTKRALVMNAGGIANYFVWDYFLLWNNSYGTVIQWTAGLAVNLPVLLYTLYQWLVPEPDPLSESPALQYRSTKELTSYDSA